MSCMNISSLLCNTERTIKMVSSPLLMVILTLRFSNVLSADDDDDDDKTDLMNCMPQLADSCFKDVYSNLECHIGSKTTSTTCNDKDMQDLCGAVYDSLSCASDIVDNDCSLSDGRDTFDSWMQGLQAVYKYFCKKSNESLKVMVENNLCWNSLEFIMCVERTTKVTHVVDLLQVILDINECNRLLIALSTCNVRASRLSPECYPPQEVISEVIHTFFSQTKCGSVCDSSSSVIESAAIITLMSLFIIFM